MLLGLLVFVARHPRHANVVYLPQLKITAVSDLLASQNSGIDESRLTHTISSAR